MSTRDTILRERFSVSRYDIVLTVIPSAFLLALLVADALSVTPRVALAVASLVGALAVADALFFNPPARRT